MKNVLIKVNDSCTNTQAKDCISFRNIFLVMLYNTILIRFGSIKFALK